MLGILVVSICVNSIRFSLSELGDVNWLLHLNWWLGVVLLDSLKKYLEYILCL